MTAEMILSYLMVAEKIVFYVGQAVVTINTRGMTIEQMKAALDAAEKSWPDFKFDSPVED